MTFVITRLCRDCVDGACVEVCPVQCIVEHAPPHGASDLPNQLFINPDECIHCLLCEPACPWQAIFDEADVPLPLGTTSRSTRSPARDLTNSSCRQRAGPAR